MDNEIAVKIKKENESSLVLLFIVCVMLVALALYSILFPVVNRHNFLNSTINTIGGHKEKLPEFEHKPGDDNSEQRAFGAVSGDIDVVNTLYGSIRGVIEDGVRVFHGVPYADPPVGELRWKPPKDVSSWSPLIYDATWTRPGCPQVCSMGPFCPSQTSEDCLYLEIYTPTDHIKSTSTSKGLPVLIYIHGGGFRHISATSPVFHATKMVQRAGVVVVLVEYRIGALGFLYTGDDERNAQGNYGLMDQILALKWVAANIRAFGGDPERVTLAGQSAGAQSVLIHLMSDVTSQYFRYIILESPPLSLQYATKSKALNRAEKLAKSLKCLDKEGDIDMKCLKRQDAGDIVSGQMQVARSVSRYIEKIETWGPVVGTDMVKTQTMTGLKQYSEKETTKPILWGTTADEALIFVDEWMTKPTGKLVYTIAKGLLLGDHIPEDFSELYPILHPSDTREDISTIATDFLFRCPLVKFIHEMEEEDHWINVWVYTWDLAVDSSNTPEEFSMCAGRPCHGVEVPFIFQSFSFLNATPSDVDINTSNAIIDYYSNFIMYGNPNGNKLRKRTRKHAKKSKFKTYSGSRRGNSNTLLDPRPYWLPMGSEPGQRTHSSLIFNQNGNIKIEHFDKDPRCLMWDRLGYRL